MSERDDHDREEVKKWLYFTFAVSVAVLWIGGVIALIHFTIKFW